MKYQYFGFQHEEIQVKPMTNQFLRCPIRCPIRCAIRCTIRCDDPLRNSLRGSLRNPLRRSVARFVAQSVARSVASPTDAMCQRNNGRYGDETIDSPAGGDETRPSLRVQVTSPHRSATRARQNKIWFVTDLFW